MANVKMNQKQALAMLKGGMKPSEVASAFGVGNSAISNLLARVKAQEAEVAEFRSNKDKIFETVQSELLSAVKADDPKSAQQLVTSAAILDDKIRLERGQTTSHTVIDIRALIASINQDV